MKSEMSVMTGSVQKYKTHSIYACILSTLAAGPLANVDDYDYDYDYAVYPYPPPRSRFSGPKP